MDGPDGQPLLLLDRVGKGRVAMLMSDQIWLWSRGHKGGGPQAELLRRIAHWTMKEPELEEEALTARIDQGQLLIERRSTADTPPPAITVTDPNGARQTRDAARVRPRPGQRGAGGGGPGRLAGERRDPHRLCRRLGRQSAGDRRSARHRDASRGLVHASGGSTHWLDPAGAPELRRTGPEAEQAGYGWIGMRQNHDHLVTGIAAIPLLPPWLALPLILGLAVVAWRQEGQ